MFLYVYIDIYVYILYGELKLYLPPASEVAQEEGHVPDETDAKERKPMSMKADKEEERRKELNRLKRKYLAPSQPAAEEQEKIDYV